MTRYSTLALLADVVQRADVGVVQPGDGLRFALEPLPPLGLRGGVGGQHLDRDGAGDPRVARAVDLAHPSPAQEGDDFVRPQKGAG